MATENGTESETRSPAGTRLLQEFDRSSSVLNAGDGIRTQGAGAVVHIGSATMIGNGGGLILACGGQIFSCENNQATGNGVDGAPTRTRTAASARHADAAAHDLNDES